MSEEAKTTYRNEWQAGVSAIDLKNAAQAKVEYHQGRLEYWTLEERKADEAYRGSVQVRAHEVTGGNQVAVQADQEKGAYLSTCQNKRERHQHRLDTYNQWVAYLDQFGTGVALQVTYSDAEFFGLGVPTGDRGEVG